jgi:hypothetical protein
VSRWFECPYLGGPVELTDEREAHIALRHADLLPDVEALIGRTLEDPDAVHRSAVYEGRLLFSRWYSELRGGKHVLVVVSVGTAGSTRNWIVTAHMLRKPVPGEALWRRS